MQGGVASSKVLILAGAGLTGHIILSGRLPAILGELQELLKGANEVDISLNNYDPSALAAQLRRLAQEVKDLSLSRPVHIFNGHSTSSGSLASYIMPAAAVGAMGYCYMWWKGMSFSDVMFVTKRNMAKAVANVSTQMEQLSAALAVTKRHLTQRLENIDVKVVEQIETSKIIMNEVNEAKSDLSQIGSDIEVIQNMVFGLEEKVGLLGNKQDITNAGILYLCNVAGLSKDESHSKYLQEISAKFQPAQLPFSEDKLVKGLRFVAESLEPGKATEVNNTITLDEPNEKRASKTYSKMTKMTAIHRSFPGGISLTKAGLVL